MRRSRARLILILAGPALIGGYYLGQSWRRQPLDDLSVILFAEPVPSTMDGSAITAPADTLQSWRLFGRRYPGVRRAAMLRHYAQVMNRLAARPGSGTATRYVLAYDRPDAARSPRFVGGRDLARRDRRTVCARWTASAHSSASCRAAEHVCADGTPTRTSSRRQRAGGR